VSRRVLVVDDEPQILRALRIVLREAGYAVTPAGSVEEALDAAALHPPDVAIVDLLLPDGDGIQITEQLRTWTRAPIILLSAVGDEDEKVRALQAGADDYVTKPFGPRELIARVEAVLRRSAGAADEPVLRAGDVALDQAAHTVTRDGADVHLTPKEFDLLRILLRERGRMLTHRALLTEVWGPAWADDVGTLRTHMSNLRRKVGTDVVHTDPGVGYRVP
jgi:two-component system, OmpR family, KDP operon response regulator KdpE